MNARRTLAATLIGAAALLTTACSPNKIVGTQLNKFSMEHVVPAAMMLDDTAMICHANESVVPLMSGYRDYGVDTDLLMAISYSGMAMCTENEAVEKELWSALAQRQKWPDVAQDSLIAQQLLNRDAGRRQLKSYEYAVSYFRNHHHYEIGEGKCPDFRNDLEEHLLLVGATSALQAMQNDIASGRLINVDMSTPPKVARAMGCLNNVKWWGEPSAIQAALKVILPENPGDEAKAWDTLRTTSEYGVKSGVRLSLAVYASMAYAKDRPDFLRDALKRFEAVPADAINPKYRLLDQMAALQVRHIADRYWMRNEGHRAPAAGYSQFWDERKVNTNTKEYNDILNSLK